MTVEIWSDVVCPFCYIGKRKFEKALAEFKRSKDVQIEYKSFQLSPDTKTDTSINAFEALAKHKGISVSQAKQMSDQVTQMASDVGLDFHFDKAVPANTFNAHRFLHFAKKGKKQAGAKELLLKAYFTDGQNIDDMDFLVELAKKIGLDEARVTEVMESDQLTEDVQMDIYEAQQFGIRGVPFFVFDRKYAVSGAQDSDVFLKTLEKSFTEWSDTHIKSLETIEGESCSADGECD